MHVRGRSLLYLIVAQFALGSAAIFVRFALSGTGPLNASFLRVLIAAPIAVALARFAKKNLSLPPPVRSRVVLAGAILGLHFALWIVSLQYTSVVVATLLVCTTPFWLAIMDVAIRRHVPKPAVFAAFAFAILAGFCVVRSGPTPTSSGDDSVLGAVLALGAALLFAVYLTIVRTAQQAASTLTLISYAYPSTLIVLGPAALLAHEPLPHTRLAWGGILGMALVAQLIGHTALAAALRGYSSGTVSFVGLSEPVISAVAAALLLGEPLRAPVVAGGLVLLIAIAIVLASDTTPPTALDTPEL